MLDNAAMKAIGARLRKDYEAARPGTMPERLMQLLLRLQQTQGAKAA